MDEPNFFDPLISATGSREQHFKNLNLYQEQKKPAEWMLGKYWRIDAEIFNEFLCMLPPIYHECGFRLCEELTEGIASAYLKIDGEYWSGFVSRSITPSKLANHIRSLP